MGLVGIGAHAGLSFRKGKFFDRCPMCKTNRVKHQGKKYTLANTHRPREIGDWFQYGRRSWDKQPLIPAADIDRYSTDWWKWWAELQPASRSAEDPLLMPRQIPDDGQWLEAMKGTNNGLYMVLVALGWWAQGVQFAGQDMKAWVQATADVIWVVEQMQAVAEETQKRARDDEDEEIESAASSCAPPSKRCTILLSSTPIDGTEHTIRSKTAA